MFCCANTKDPKEIKRQKVEAILEHVSEGFRVGFIAYRGNFLHRSANESISGKVISWFCCHLIALSRLPLLICITIKVIPQKLNLPMNFFKTFPESSLLSTVSKKTIKMIGHHSRLRDMMGQSYPIYACTSAYHAHYLSVHVTFCGSSKHTLFK